MTERLLETVAIDAGSEVRVSIDGAVVSLTVWRIEEGERVPTGIRIELDAGILDSQRIATCGLALMRGMSSARGFLRQQGRYD